ncbi:ParA family protein [Staphylococcus saprophyticus]|uniref:ParA family protein n=1 Tax=Staphylococcus saprophyticus TaxID=29385 RepID=UPI001F1ACF25|nr:ParA family protein [Staphylococcus saprophyticus]
MNNEKMPIVVTVNQQKGGVGKSTLVKLLTNHLALEKDKKVLNIDGDYSGYLTHLYGVFDAEGHIGELFKTKDNDEEVDNIKYHEVHENINLITYDSRLNDKEKKLLGEEQISFILMRWVGRNEAKLSEYDYIIIDTHNDFELFTKNAIAISEVVLAPLDPSDNEEFVTTRMEYEFNKFKKSLIEPISGKSYVQAQLYTLGNQIKHNFSDDQNFLEKLKKRNDYLTYFKHKSLIIKASKNIKTMEELMGKEKSKHKEFYDSYKIAMEKIENVIDQN